LVNKELYDTCQEVRAARRTSKGSYQPTSHIYLLNGIVICIHCGRRLRAQSGRICYYRDVSYQSGHECIARRTGTNAEVIDNQAAQLIKSLHLPAN
jgi:hypothetical protein